MTGYQKIINQMRHQAELSAEKGVQLGTMGEGGTCRVGELVLERDDYLIAKHLLTGYTDKDGNAVGAVSMGDTVVVKRINEELYIIIERVV